MLFAGVEERIALIGACGTVIVTLVTGAFALLSRRVDKPIAEVAQVMSSSNQQMEGWEDLFESYRTDLARVRRAFDKVSDRCERVEEQLRRSEHTNRELQHDLAMAQARLDGTAD